MAAKQTEIEKQFSGQRRRQPGNAGLIFESEDDRLGRDINKAVIKKRQLYKNDENECNLNRFCSS